MARTVLINGVDRTALCRGPAPRVSYTDVINARNNGKIRIRDVVGGVSLVYGQSFELLDDDGVTVLFAGIVGEPTRSFPTGKLDVIEWSAPINGYEQICDRRAVAEIYDSKTVREIARDIVSKYLAADGITAADFVDVGVTIDHWPILYDTATQAFNDLSTMSGLPWWIDWNKKLHFQDPAENIAPWGIDSTTGSNIGCLTDFQLQTQLESVQYRNREFLRAGTATTDPRTEHFGGDGKVQAFTTVFPVHAVPTITLNGTAQTVGIKGIDSGMQWYWNKSVNVIAQDAAGTPIANTDDLAVTYVGEFPIIALAQNDQEIANRVSVEGGSGYYDWVDDDQSVDSQSLAVDEALGWLSTYGQIRDLATFSTDTPGLRAGMLFAINVPELDLNHEQFLIQQVDAADLDGLHLRYKVKAISGDAIAGWLEYWRQQAYAGRKFVTQQNEVLQLLRQTQDPVQCLDTLVANVSAPENRIGYGMIGFMEIG